MSARRSLPQFLVAVALLGMSATRAAHGQDVPPPDDGLLLGTWSGVVVDDSDSEGSVVLDLDALQGRRYTGLIGLVPPSPVVPPNPAYPVDPIRVILAASGRVSLTGHSDDWSLSAHGVLLGNQLLLEYHLNFLDGRQNRGLMLLSR